MNYLTHYPSPIGILTLASNGTALTGLWIENQAHFGSFLTGDETEQDNLPVFNITRTWLDAYFAGLQPSPALLPLAPEGSDFRRHVWKILLEIPYGQTTTYGEISHKLGAGCAQAVGGAVGHNPISIIIPCHRVLSSNGNLTGYAGGIERKLWLLNHEGLEIRK